MSDPKETEPSGNPAFGCLIFAAAAAIFVGLALWTVYIFFVQDRAIAEFTRDVKEPTPIVEVDASAAAALLQRLTDFAEVAGAGGEAELSLTPDDLNLMISSIEPLAVYRGLVHFTEIDAEGMLKADVCLPMRKAKFWENRYLVGTAKMEVRREDDTVQMVVSEVEVPGEEIPEGFNRNFAHWLWLQPYQEDEKIGPVLTATREVEMTEGRVVLRARPAQLELPPKP